MPCCLPGTGDDGHRVEVTVHWWNQADEDKQVDIIVTNIIIETQKQFESQPGVTLFYLPVHLTVVWCVNTGLCDAPSAVV